MKTGQLVIQLSLVVILSMISLLSFGQTPTDSLPDDPGIVSVTAVQNMSFGAFTQGATGGTVVISNTGTRSVTGSIVALNSAVSFFQAIFEIDAPQGTVISILNGPTATLTGSNGGSVSLALGASDPASPFSTTVAQPLKTQVNIGGTLTVGNSTASPPGSYSGTFSITVNYD